MLKSILLGSAFGCGLLVIAWSATSATSYQQCAAGQADHYTQQNSPDFFEKSHTIVMCQGAVLDANSPFLTALATIFIAIFTLTLRRSTDKLWEAGDNQRKDTRSAIAANLLTARAAKKQADIAEKSLHAVERAWVFVTAIEFEMPNYVFKGRLILDNYGRAPGNIAEFRFYVRILDHIPLAADEPTPTALGLPEEGKTVLVYVFPGKPWHSDWGGCHDPFTPAAIAALNQGERHIYMWGKIAYRDYLERPHETNYCRRLNLKTSEWEIVGDWVRNASS